MLISKKYEHLTYIIPYDEQQPVHSSLFSHKVIEIKCFALRAAILHQNYLGVCKSRWLPLMVRRAISRQSHRKIGDYEQSKCAKTT